MTIALAGAAWVYPGVSQTDLELNDGGVWVTSTNQHLVGRVNYPSRQIDSAVRTASAHFDVTQNANEVLMADADAALVSTINPALVELISPTSVSPTARLVQGGDRVIAYDPQDGSLRATSTREVTTLPSMQPLLDKLPSLTATVGQDGSVHAVSGTGQLVTATATSQGWSKPSSQQLDLPEGGDLAITAVGGQPVVLETGTGVLHLPQGAKADLGGSGYVLQQPGPQASSVLVASRTNLLSVPLDGGAPTPLVSADQVASADGVAAQPVLLQGCAYGAWTSSGQFIRHCPDAAPEVKTDKLLAASHNPVFRVNRTAIVLNDTVSGNVWLPDENLVLVDKWVDATAQSDDDADQQDKSAKATDSKKAKPDRSEENHAPVAVDDTFGVRPGRTTVLPVLANDADTDGDVLTAASAYSGTLGTVSTGQAGRTLQITVPEGTTGSAALPYTASDGRGLSDSAVASVTVHDWSTNAAPVPSKERQELTVAQGGTISAYVLGGWQDPDGDPVFLVSASGSDVEVQTTQEGTLTVRDTGSSPGTRSIEVLVSDGRETTASTVVVEVAPADQVTPLVNADHVRVVAGSTVTVSPLTNDVSPTGEPLKLAQLQEAPAGTQIDLDRRAGTFTFSSDVPQTYYLEYGAIGGAALATSVVRVDVLEKSDPSVPPVAEDDTALLRDGGSVTVAPLENDFDPAGGVLVLQEVSAPSAAGVSVTVIDHAYLQVAATDVVPEGLSVTYTVSNGTATATGTVSVVRASQDDSQPPVAQPDTAVVSAGDIVTIPVLENDYSPSRLPLKLASETSTIGESLGTAWVSDRTLRFKAGDVPGPTTLTYTVVDSHGQQSSGTAALEVRAPAAETNAPPHAEPLQAQTVTGQDVRIPVPLDGIDPDGDSVTLTGLDQPPRLGTVKVEATWLTYTPAPTSAGTDTFTYTVEDRYGAKSTGSVRVGIAPAAATNAAPVAVDDVITAQPGRTVAVDLVSNDLDGDGDSLSLAEDPVTDDPALTIQVRAGRAVVTLPAQEGVHTLRYTVTDSRGGTDTGTASFQVLRTAPLLAPVGVDDYAQMGNADPDGTVLVPVLDNDRDDDGSPWTLSVSTNDPAAVVVEDKVRVTLQDQPRLVLYTVTDQDGLSGNAVIQVPGLASTPPRVDSGTVPVHVPQDQPSDLPLAGHVITRAGTSPSLVNSSSPRVTPGLASASPQAGGTALRLVPEPGFSGATSVTFEVTDGAASNPLSSTLTIPVVVDSTTNTPPVFTPTQVTVTAGGPAVTADLSSMTRDADAADLATMTYTIGPAPTGFTVSQAGSQLTVSSPAGTADNTQGALPVTISDGKSNPVSSSLPLRSVSQDDNALPTVLPASLTSDGRPVTVDVRNLVSTTLPDAQVSLVGAPTVTSGQGSATAQGGSITVTPDPGFHGRLVVSFRVTDDPQKPNRVVSGSIVVAVAGAPAAPTGVRAVADSETSALVSWAVGRDNGSQVTGYTLTETGGAGSWSCPSTPCRATGLAPGASYSFQVVAHSNAGDSAPSAPSGPVRLTLRPQTPSAPSLSGGRGTLTASWSAVPAVSGGVTYQVVLSPEVTGVQSVTVQTPDTSVSFQEGQITVGVPYHATVRAIPNNPNGEQSGVSAPSSSASAYGAPGKPGAPRGAFNSDDQLDLQWSPADSNGSPVTYSVSVSGPGMNTSIDAGSRTYLRVNDIGRGVYTFKVTATNAGGSSSSEPWSVEHTTVPLTPSIPALASNNVRGQLEVSARSNPVSGRGWSAADLEIEYEIALVGATGNPWVVALEPGGSITGLGNGRAYVLRARAVGADGSRSHPTSWSAPATPVSSPAQGQVSCHTSDRTISCQWSADTGTGLSTSYVVTRNGETISSASSGTTDQRFPDEAGEMEVCVRASNALGQNQTCGIGRVDAPRPKVAVGTTIRFPALLDSPDAICSEWDLQETGISAKNCRRIVLQLEGFNPNSTVTCSYKYSSRDDDDDDDDHHYKANVSIGPDGSAYRVFPHRLNLKKVSSYKVPCTQQ